jgi:hypothetical protein
MFVYFRLGILFRLLNFPFLNFINLIFLDFYFLTQIKKSVWKIEIKENLFFTDDHQVNYGVYNFFFSFNNFQLKL